MSTRRSLALMVAALALAACGSEEPAAPAPLKTVRLEISGLS